jgi:histone deacetylase 1/2
MENANSKDYLEKIKTQVIENLKKTAHAPSVQLTEVPRTTLAGTTDEDEDILDDEDEDMNKDVRTTKRSWDQRVTRDDELDESEDEEEARANGVTPKDGPKRRNVSAGPDVEMETASPAPEASASKVSKPESATQVTEGAVTAPVESAPATVPDPTEDVAMTDSVQEREPTAEETASKEPETSNKVA